MVFGNMGGMVDGLLGVANAGTDPELFRLGSAGLSAMTESKALHQYRYPKYIKSYLTQLWIFHW